MQFMAAIAQCYSRKMNTLQEDYILYHAGVVYLPKVLLCLCLKQE